MRAFEARASTILYNVLRSRQDPRPFLLPANVCPVVPLTFLRAGQPFALVDIGKDLGMNQEQCLGRLERRPGAFGGVLYVRPYGALAKPEPLFLAARARQPDLLVIDDRCLCRPDGARPSVGADVTLFSTGRAKHTDLGFGGFAHLRGDVAYRRHSGMYRPEALVRLTRRYELARARGRPFRGATGAWLVLAPPDLPWSRFRRRMTSAARVAEEHRRRLNAIYAGSLPRQIQLPPDFQAWRFNVLVPEPDRLVGRLFAAGLFASRHYPSLGGVLSPGRFPAAAAVHRWIVNLFNDRNYDERMAGRTAEIVAAHVGGSGRRARQIAASMCLRVWEARDSGDV